jgi:hypothetical protein
VQISPSELGVQGEKCEAGLGSEFMSYSL